MSDIYDMMCEMLPLIQLPIFILIITTVLRIVMNFLTISPRDIERAKENERIRKKNKDVEIDNDLKKYFNYKE